jgi:DNA mismatch repair protein MutS2
MNERSLKKLEYHKIIHRLATHAVTTVAKERIEKLTPSSDRQTVLRWQQETTEALNMAIKKGKLPVVPLQEIYPSIKRMEIGAVLSSGEILNLAKLLNVARSLKRYYKEDKLETSYPALETYFENLAVYQNIEHEIARCIIAVDEYADDATETLYQVRKQMKTTNNKVRETLQGILHNSHYQEMLQESVITMRQDRYCIPVKVEYKNAFKGIVHDQSATGATVFMEPLGVVELNNKMRELMSQEQEEIEKILAHLTELLEGIAQELGFSFENVVALDMIFAKAEFSLKIDGREPKFNEKGFVHLKKARHPLLNQEEVVPIDVYVGDSFSTLLITGPNTGGKTVTLKTVGLFTLMAQTGMQIPAGEGSTLPIFDEVFSDLGDEQSIEQNLSTFSAHMTNLVAILEAVTPNSLVLLDEVGSGTDPVEGAALAMAILEHLRSQQIRTVATTHYSELKLYALSTEGVENASCEFDVETLRPTYKLLIGIPGKSNAFAISMKLGLNEKLIEAAKDFLQKENVKMEDILVELEYSKKMAEVEKERAQKFREEAEHLKEEIATQRKKIEKSKQKILEKANQKANALLKEVEEETEKVLKEVRQAARKAQVTIDEKSLQEAKENVKNRLNEKQGVINKVVGPKKTFKTPLKNLKAGEEVFLSTLMQQGVVISPEDAGGNVTVRVGILPMKVHISNLERVGETEETEKRVTKPKAKAYGNSHHVAKTAQIRPEIDVRGLMVDEALPIVDKYLDDAYLAGLKQATIIHGKGTGALRQAISGMLKRHPHVVSFRPGKYGEGEMGVTVVEIK